MTLLVGVHTVALNVFVGICDRDPFPITILRLPNNILLLMQGSYALAASDTGQAIPAMAGKDPFGK